MRVLTLAVVHLFLSLTSCGVLPGLDEDDDDSSSRSFTSDSIGTPIDYRLENADCNSPDAVSLLAAQSPISKFYSGEHVRQSFSLVLTQKRFRFEIDLEDRSEVKNLGLCTDPSRVSENTLEGVSLEVREDINAAYEAYTMTNGSKRLAPVQVNIHPKYHSELHIYAEAEDETYKEDIAGYMTDNAAWTYFYDDFGLKKFELLFFPKSREMQADGGLSGKGLWEIPFVSHHEYAHHIFYHTLESSLSLMGISREKFFGNRLLTPAFWPQRNNLGAHIQQIDIPSDNSNDYDSIEKGVGAINEGFADLFANASAGTEELSEFRCFAGTREVESDSFFDGEPKTLTRQVLDTFLTPEDSTGLLASMQQDDERATCETYSYTDVHTVGAILANGLHKILSDQDDRIYLERLSSWLTKLGSATSTYSGEELLRTAVMSAAEVSKESSLLDEQACASLIDSFPVFRESLTGGYCN